MYRRRKRTEVSIETRQVLTIRQPGTFHASCGVCRRRVKFVSVEASAAALGVTMRRVFYMVEAGELHFTETLAGQLFVCSDSLNPTG